MSLIQRRFYLPEALYNKLSLLAESKGQSITETLRELLEKGLSQEKPDKNTAKGLLKLAKLVEKEKWTAPKDLSANHNRYFIEAYTKDKK